MSSHRAATSSVYASWSLFEKATIVLVAVTLLLLAWQRFGMNEILTITPKHVNKFWAESDAQEGGNSIAQMQAGSTFEMHCAISAKSIRSYPYCNFFFGLEPDGSGIDLTKYEDVRITLKHRSTAPDNLKIFLNHFYQGGTASRYPFKVNMYRLSTNGEWQSFDIPIKDFFVPTWWLCQSNAENPAAELGNVKHFGISSGESTAGRDIQVEVKKIEFRRKRITTETLQRWLLFGWLAWVVALLLFKMFRLSRQSAHLQKRSSELEKRNARLREKSGKLQYLAQHDALTALYNRTGLAPVLQRALAQYRERHEPFCVLIIDLDHFKRVNDELGHDAGDEVLRGFARLLSERSRKTDIPGRWGGEEFLIICQATELKGALTLAETLVATTRTAQLLPDRKVTCSIGVAEMHGTELEPLLRQADEALYKAKAAGRDRAVAYG